MRLIISHFCNKKMDTSDDITSINVIDNTLRDTLLKNFKERTEGFLFRQVKSVEVNGLLGVRRVYVDETDLSIKDQHISFEEWETLRETKDGRITDREYEEIFHDFIVTTEKYAFSKGDKFHGELRLFKSHQSTFNHETFTLVPSDKSRINGTPPKHGDFVCFIRKIVDLPSGKRKVVYRWFTCTPQLMRMWRMIFLTSHKSFKSNDENRIREYAMSGNRLCVNAYKKWFLSQYQNSRIPDVLSAAERFHVIRTEPHTREFVHIYAAVVLMLRYGEYPSLDNIPQNKDFDDDSQMKGWDLPERYIEKFIKNFS